MKAPFGLAKLTNRGPRGAVEWLSGLIIAASLGAFGAVLMLTSPPVPPAPLGVEATSTEPAEQLPRCTTEAPGKATVTCRTGNTTVTSTPAERSLVLRDIRVRLLGRSNGRRDSRQRVRLRLGIANRGGESATIRARQVYLAVGDERVSPRSSFGGMRLAPGERTTRTAVFTLNRDAQRALRRASRRVELMVKPFRTAETGPRALGVLRLRLAR